MSAEPVCLVADESLMVRRVAARIIRDFGYEVVEAKTGLDALDAARMRLPDVVLLDWSVGGMRADAIIEGIRSESGGADVRVIFCTADRRVERITEALAAGADEYVMKPFDSDILESKFTLAGLAIRPGRPRAA